MRYLLTTVPGIEDLAGEEIVEALPGARLLAAPGRASGVVRVEVDASADRLRRLGMIHHIVEIRGEARAATLDDVRRIVGAMQLPELADARSFRVSSGRMCRSDFTRRELEGAAGAAIQRRYGTPVDLEGFQINVRVDLHGDDLVVGLQRTAKSLSKRIHRQRILRTGIKPTIAAAMIRLAGAHHGPGRLVDPLCGVGTISIEAKRINPQLEVHASDWDPETVEAARGTVANHGLDIDVRAADARSLASAYSGSFDYVVTDPPYGVRLGKRSSIRVLYSALLRSFERVLSDTGTVVLVAVKLRTFRAALAESGLSIADRRSFEAGGLEPHILVLKRADLRGP